MRGLLLGLSICAASPVLAQSFPAGVMVDQEAGTPGMVLTIPDPARPWNLPPLSDAGRSTAITAVKNIFDVRSGARLPAGLVVGISDGRRHMIDKLTLSELRTRLSDCKAGGVEDLHTERSSNEYFLFRLVCGGVASDQPQEMLTVGVSDNKVATIYLNLSPING